MSRNIRRLRVAQVVMADCIEPLVAQRRQPGRHGDSQVRASPRCTIDRGECADSSGVPDFPTPIRASCASAPSGSCGKRRLQRRQHVARRRRAIEFRNRSDQLVKPIADDEAVDVSAPDRSAASGRCRRGRLLREAIDQSGRARHDGRRVRLSRMNPRCTSAWEKQ